MVVDGHTGDCERCGALQQRVGDLSRHVERMRERITQLQWEAS
jgi:hypothetical protein